MTYRINMSLWWNHGERNELAIPDVPELGKSPHAQVVMDYLGIKYTSCNAHPIADCWIFHGCDKHPMPIPKWMTVTDE